MAANSGRSSTARTPAAANSVMYAGTRSQKELALATKEWGRAMNAPGSPDWRRPMRRARETTATFKRTERAKRALRGVDA
eukprot:6193258-Pleurochrysis_carterae.AAC.2